MKPKLLSWNVRRLNEGEKRLRVRNLLREWKASVIEIQETKMELMSYSIVCSLWYHSHADWCCLDFRGASSGILLI